MKLFYLPNACSMADHIVLEWIGQPYDTEKVARDALKSPEYLRLNPSGAVPTLVDGDWALTENVAILNYLADRFPEAGLGGDGTPRGRAEVNRWLAFINSDVHKAFVPLFKAAHFIDDENQHDALKAKARSNIRTLLKRIDDHLSGRDWLANDRRSIADPYLYVILRWAEKQAIDLSGLDRLATFRRRMDSDAGVRAVLAAEGLG
jgi:glutathione S-transferase